MGLRCGIIGLPNVGKSTLFNALTAAGAEASNYPFCTIDPNVGIVPVPDARLDFLATVFHPQKVTPTTMEFVDIAGLVRGAGRGEGLGNQFLSHIREMDALVHVVRCFDDQNVVHVDGSVNPARDIEVVEAELIFKDLETVGRRKADLEKRARSGDKKSKNEAELCDRIEQHLLTGRLARYLETQHDEERALLHGLHLLTAKPVLYVCNIAEAAGGSGYVEAVRGIAVREGARVATISAEVEAEIAELPAGDRKEFLEGLGLSESGLEKLIREGYDALRLITFFTGNNREVRAWTVQLGTTAPRAAGTIHSDFERGFIRAEVMKYEHLARLHTEHAVKEKGLLQIEGREYVVQDGDVIYFRFNV